MLVLLLVVSIVPLMRIIQVLFIAYYFAWGILSPSCCDAFNSCTGSNNPPLLSWSSSSWSGRKTTQRDWHRTSSSPRTIIAHAAARDDGDADGENHIKTSTAYYETKLSSDYSREGGKKQRKVYSRIASWLRRTKTSSATHDDTNVSVEKQQQCSTPTYRFTYDYNEGIIDGTSKRADSQQTKTTGIMLIHPIGVGIGKWYYNRLFAFFLQERCNNNDNSMMEDQRLVILAPDLLGSATACCPTDIASGTVITNKLPLLNITDWSGQILHLMSEYETKCRSEERGYTVDNWCIVANGGCSPIALHVAASSYSTMLNQTGIPYSLRAPVTHVILSSPPRLSFFLPNSTASSAIDPNKVHKSYRTLSGIVGQLFWWYALRNNGTFIQTFSEKNLVGNATNLGKDWTPTCIATARLHNGQSRYSTFAFLAGSLRDGCVESLRVLLKGHNSPIKIDFIRGTDRRRNRARSWFWTWRGKWQEKGADTKENGGGGGGGSSSDVASSAEEITIQQYVSKNGNGGREVFVNGARISLAWENADEYAKRLLELCAE